MPLSDQIRIANDRLKPRIVELWHALVPLRTIVSFMNTGAHPDDEISEMLAALGFRDGIDLSYACSTRGEGGQNDIGREATEALGVLRTAEMERAADVLNLRLYWLSESPGDSVFDFGFSKSGVETLGRWGRERTLKRFVDILRTEKPDIICPTFLDVPGQHGHHRAMTEAAHLVMDLSEDPAYADSTLPPWQVKKLYLPAWSGAGQAYDDDLPPPPATLTINADGIDPVTGFSFDRIGQQSRVFHKTQGMGKWVPAGAERNWPLHLADSRVDGPDKDIFSGLTKRLSDLGNTHLDSSQKHIEAACGAFPDSATILDHASAALAALNQASALFEDPRIGHKLLRKKTQLSKVIRIAAGADVSARTADDILRTGGSTSLEIETQKGQATNIEVAPMVPNHWRIDGMSITVGGEAVISDPYPATYLPDTPTAPCLRVFLTTHDVSSETLLPLEVVPVVVPSYSAAVAPLASVLNIASDIRTLEISVSDISPSHAKADLVVPDGWQAERTDAGFLVKAPEIPVPGLYELSLTLDGAPAQTIQHIHHEHTAPRALVKPARLAVRVVDVDLAKSRVGYAGGGHDRVDYWLASLGCDVTPLTDADLHNDTALSEFDTIVIGIFALKFRGGLVEQMPRLNNWCEQGGTLVTLYHRPWDNWDPDGVPPRRLEIGQPSLRWRVTDETARVTHLDPKHSLLTTPNTIGLEDWTGWHKERGLYFAKSWDVAYAPLLEMSDPDEAPQRGSLLVADIGQGRHVHTSLILHHQMEILTAGAFRIMANIVAKRR